MKRDRERGIILKSCAGLVASLVVVSVAALNISPALAHAVGDVPGLSALVRVVTFGRYDNVENGYEAHIVTPRITGLSDEELMKKLNEEFEENADALISAYEEDVRKLKEEFGDETVHMGIDAGYEVKTDNDRILALDMYIQNTAGSSSTVHSFYTIDKETGELLTLPGMFRDGADYISPISEYIKSEMRRLNAEEDGMFWIDESGIDVFERISPEQNFYIDDDGELVICFDKYEVAAGAQGSPEFKIPSSVIDGILK